MKRSELAVGMVVAFESGCPTWTTDGMVVTLDPLDADGSPEAGGQYVGIGITAGSDVFPRLVRLQKIVSTWAAWEQAKDAERARAAAQRAVEAAAYAMADNFATQFGLGLSISPMPYASGSRVEPVVASDAHGCWPLVKITLEVTATAPEIAKMLAAAKAAGIIS